LKAEVIINKKGQRRRETKAIDQKPRFLPDADMTEDLMETSPNMSLTVTSQAKSPVFDFRLTLYRSTRRNVMAQ
jgi:hypothetical protein